jgi:hypothetical protein
MKTLAVVIGVVVIVVLLVGSGALGGAICIDSVGCLYSSDGSVSIDNRESVTVSTGRP